MTDQPANKVKRWTYPFTAINGKEVEDPQAYFDALSRAQDGFYPLGVNGLWHGGVHFDSGTGAKLAQDGGIRAIADGEVIAYRIDADYPKVEYADKKQALYSTGFVLIRHRLELPPNPNPKLTTPAAKPVSGAAPAVPATTPVAPEALTFYSLYMHTLSWKIYQQERKRKRPAFWGGASNDFYVVGAKAKDKYETIAPRKIGLRIRSADHTTIGLIPRGTQISLGTAHPTRAGYFELKSVVEGNIFPPDTTTGYVYKAELDPTVELDTGAIDKVYILPQPKPIAAGDLVGHLGEYQRYSDASALPPVPMRPQLHLEIFTGDDIEGFIAKSRAYAAKLDESQKTQFSIEVGAQLCQPAAPDQTLAAGVAVKVLSGADAGKGPWQRVQPLKTVILARGVLGAYNAKSGGHGSYVYQGQHADFTGRYLGATDTVSTTDAEEGKKAIYTRREVHMPEGQPVWVERSLGTDAAVARAAWRTFPLQLSAAKAPIAAQLRVIRKSQLGKLGSHECAQDEHGTHWWKISVGTSDQGSAEGWVCEKAHPKTRWTSPWDWPGFDIVGESAPPKDFLQRNLHLNDAAQDAAEAKNFKVKADALDGGPLLATLKSAIDAQGKKDGVITAGELRKSLRQPWLAERIGKLIVRYESEWGGDMSKWDALDPLMFEGEPNWQAEKARIKKLQIWDQAKSIAGFPADPEVKHFHSIGLVGNFAGNCNCINYDVMYASQGPAYRDDQIKSYSHYNVPIDMTPGRLAGNSRRHGDASHDVQKQVIDIFVNHSKNYQIDRNDLAMILAIARVESGFNPDAAAGTTSASGLGQFVDATATHYGIMTDAQRFDAQDGAVALIEHYLENKVLATAAGHKDRDLYIMIYAYHHDGPSLAYGGEGISRSEVMPKFDLYLNNICENVL